MRKVPYWLSDRCMLSRKQLMPFEHRQTFAAQQTYANCLRLMVYDY